MLDINAIRKDSGPLMAEVKKRGQEFDIDDFLKLDQERRDLIQKTDEQRSQLKSANAEIAQLEGKEKQARILELKAVSDRLTEDEAKLAALTKEWEDQFLKLPNITHDTVPAGGEANNVVEREEGTKPSFSFTPKPHWELLEQHGWFDRDRAAEVSGSRFWYVKGDVVRLQMALQNWAFGVVAGKGYEPVIPPYLVKEEALYGTGFFPGADEGEVYRVPEEDHDDLFLIGTSEVSLVSLHAKETLDLSGGPKKYLGLSPCYRREAGTYGKDTKGIIRGHQFDKLEMVVFCKPEDSWTLFDEITGIQEEILQQLGLAYRMYLPAAGDTGNKNAKTYEPEAWFPGEDRYIEVQSVSNVTDYQARRLGVKVLNDEGKKVVAHTLNGTVVAMSRMLAAIIENYQQEDGSVRVPEVLQPLMGTDVIGAAS